MVETRDPANKLLGIVLSSLLPRMLGWAASSDTAGEGRICSDGRRGEGFNKRAMQCRQRMQSEALSVNDETGEQNRETWFSRKKRSRTVINCKRIREQRDHGGKYLLEIIYLHTLDGNGLMSLCARGERSVFCMQTAMEMAGAEWSRLFMTSCENTRCDPLRPRNPWLRIQRWLVNTTPSTDGGPCVCSAICRFNNENMWIRFACVNAMSFLWSIS